MSDESQSAGPVKLVDYCERHGFHGLTLLAFIGHASKMLAKKTTDDSTLQLPIANGYASYLLGYARWIGVKTGNIADGFADGRRALRNLPERAFLSIKGSQDIIDFIKQFYANEGNVERSENYCGWGVRTDLDTDAVFKKLNANQMLLLTLSEKRGWSAEYCNAALRGIYPDIDMPLFFCEEESQEWREFWNFAFIGVLTTELDCKWGCNEEMLVWPQLCFILTTGTQEIRKMVAERKINDF